MKLLKGHNRVMISKGDYVRLGPKYYKYVGQFENIKDVPISDCLYVISGHLYVRRFDLERLNSMKVSKPKVEKDTSDKLDLTIKPEDNDLLIILKELLKGYTKNDFKKLFEDDNDVESSNCNNMRRSIEAGNGQLSWIRFCTMMTKLGLKYSIKVYKKEELSEPNKNVDEDNSSDDDMEY